VVEKKKECPVRAVFDFLKFRVTKFLTQRPFLPKTFFSFKNFAKMSYDDSSRDSYGDYNQSAPTAGRSPSPNERNDPFRRLVLSLFDMFCSIYQFISGHQYDPKKDNNGSSECINYSGKTLRDVTGTVSAIVTSQDGSRFIQCLIDEGPDGIRRQIFDEIYPDAKTIMMDAFGNYVMQKLIDHATVEQMALLVPAFHDHISELAENKISNYPLQKIIQFISENIHSPSLSEDIAKRFGYFLEDLFEVIESRTKELCCHPVGTRVVQCMVEYLPDSWKNRILRGLLRCFDDLATNYYGSVVLQVALNHFDEDFLELLSSKVLLRLSDYSNNQYAFIFVKYLLSCHTRFTSNVAWELINQNFRGNEISAVVRLLNSGFGHQVLMKLITSCDEDQRTVIQSFVENHRYELTRTQYGSIVLSSFYDALNRRLGLPADGAPPPSSVPPRYARNSGGDGDRERKSTSRNRFPQQISTSADGDAYGHKRKRSASRSPHRSDPPRENYYPIESYDRRHRLFPSSSSSSLFGRELFFLFLFLSIFLGSSWRVYRSPSASSRYPVVDVRRAASYASPSSYAPGCYDSVTYSDNSDNRDHCGFGDYRPRPLAERVKYTGKTGTIATLSESVEIQANMKTFYEFCQTINFNDVAEDIIALPRGLKFPIQSTDDLQNFLVMRSYYPTAVRCFEEGVLNHKPRLVPRNCIFTGPPGIGKVLICLLPLFLLFFLPYLFWFFLFCYLLSSSPIRAGVASSSFAIS
jgi:hypothetical protein